MIPLYKLYVRVNVGWCSWRWCGAYKIMTEDFLFGFLCREFVRCELLFPVVMPCLSTLRCLKVAFVIFPSAWLSDTGMESRECLGVGISMAALSRSNCKTGKTCRCWTVVRKCWLVSCHGDSLVLSNKLLNCSCICLQYAFINQVAVCLPACAPST